MKINLRWLVQAVVFIGCIYFFMRIWNASKIMISGSSSNLIELTLYALLFLLCFFVMAVTSYLKQKQNGTLKNPIPFFERLLSKLGLA